MTSEIRNLLTPTSEYRVRVHVENRGTEEAGRWPLVTAYPVLWDRVTRDAVGRYRVGQNPVTRDESRQVVLVEGDSLLRPNSKVGPCTVEAVTTDCVIAVHWIVPSVSRSH